MTAVQIWLLAQVSLVSAVFFVGAILMTDDRPVFARLVISILCAIGWPILLPIAMYLHSKENDQK